MIEGNAVHMKSILFTQIIKLRLVFNHWRHSVSHLVDSRLVSSFGNNAVFSILPKQLMKSRLVSSFHQRCVHM